MKDHISALATAAALIRETAEVMRTSHCTAPDFDLATMDPAVRVDYDQELRAADRLDALREELATAQPRAWLLGWENDCDGGSFVSETPEYKCKDPTVTITDRRPLYLAPQAAINAMDGNSELAAMRVLLAESKREIERLRKDAERYRFYRDADRSADFEDGLQLYSMESLDEFIDRAMEASNG